MDGVTKPIIDLIAVPFHLSASEPPCVRCNDTYSYDERAEAKLAVRRTRLREKRVQMRAENPIRSNFFYVELSTWLAALAELLPNEVAE